MKIRSKFKTLSTKQPQSSKFKDNFNTRLKNLPAFIKEERFAHLVGFLTPPNPISLGIQLKAAERRLPKDKDLSLID